AAPTPAESGPATACPHSDRRPEVDRDSFSDWDLDLRSYSFDPRSGRLDFWDPLGRVGPPLSGGQHRVLNSTEGSTPARRRRQPGTTTMLSPLPPGPAPLVILTWPPELFSSALAGPHRRPGRRLRHWPACARRRLLP